MAQEQQSSSQENKNNNTNSQRGISRYIGWIVLAILLVVGGYYGFKEVVYLQDHVNTEDAQTTGYVSPVLPRVSGYVTQVLVDDNEHVEKGQLLVTVDTTEYALKVRKAKSALENARASLDVAQSSRQTAKVSLQKAQQDYDRAKDLYEGGATTQQTYDDAKTALNKAKSTYETAKKKVSASRTRITEKKNTLENAELNLSYTKIKAPSAGIISKKDIEVGQFIKPGGSLMAVTDKENVWVVANFKETQIKDIKVGQRVNIEVDAYPDKEFKGRVQSLAGGTGAEYALLPPDNATGNFVKVVQRVPVKITLDDQESARESLRLGLNVTTTIDITQHVDSAKTSAAAKSELN